MMNDILMWIINAIRDVLLFGLLYVCLPLAGIAIFGMLWPHIAPIVKFFTLAVPAVLVYFAFKYEGILMGILFLAGALVCVGLLWLLYRFLDNQFGVLISEEEAILEGYL